MQNEPRWLSVEDAIAINEILLRDTGEPHALNRRDLLESALARPRQQFAYSEQPDILDMAMALLFGIARNHPFVQGNKRTAFTAMIAFLDRNGYRLDVEDHGAPVADWMIGVLEGSLSEAAFRDKIAECVFPQTD